MKDIIPDVKKLLEVGAHFGHSIKRWNPKMEKYIYEERGGVHVFDLFKTRDMLEEACNFLSDAASSGKKIVFVGTKGQAVDVVREEATRIGIPYVVNRWVGGTLTNWDQISDSVEKLVDMREKMQEGAYDKYTKKEQVVLRREMERLERMYSGLVDLKKVPDILFVVDPNRESTAVDEANALGIDVVALADSNADPDMITHIIPANDDALKSVKLFVRVVSQAVEHGLKNKKKSEEKLKEAKDNKENKGKK